MDDIFQSPINDEQPIEQAVEQKDKQETVEQIQLKGQEQETKIETDDQNQLLEQIEENVQQDTTSDTLPEQSQVAVSEQIQEAIQENEPMPAVEQQTTETIIQENTLIQSADEPMLVDQPEQNIQIQEHVQMDQTPTEQIVESNNLTELTTLNETTNILDQTNTIQTAIIDPNNPSNVVLIVSNETINTTDQNNIIQAGLNLDESGVLVTAQQQQSSTSLNLNDGSNQLNLDQCDDSNLQEDNDELSFKQDIDDTLALSPNSGINSGSFILNGSNVSTHTFRKTEWDVKKLENYVRQSFGDMTPMENMEPNQMNSYLKSFFELAKKSDGMEYEPESLIGFMNSFERYLKTKNYPESLLRSETFKEARTILKKKRDLVRSIGKLIRTKTKDTCYLLQFHRNLLKEKGLLNRDNPDCLLAEIYLNNMIYFGEFLKEDKAWRGNLNLVWGDMLLERDPNNGLEYLTLATYAKKTTRNPPAQPGQPRQTTRTKTGTQTSKLRAAAAAAAAAGSTTGMELNCPRVYTRQPPLYCPIEAYKIYRSRRPNNCLDRDSPFYLAPLFKSKNNSKTWYKALAMSCQRLDALFYCLFKKAGVDLTSLASMSQQQQQQAVAAAASIMGNESNVVTPGIGWKPGMKEPNHITDVSELLTSGYLAQASAAMANNNLNNNNNSNNNTNNNTTTNNATVAAAASSSSNTVTTSYYSGTSATQASQGHHIVTTVPAQVQVQVQIQVQLSQHQQQQANHQLVHGQNALNANQNSALTLLA